MGTHFGALGVYLFFALSGFLVSLPFWHEKKAGLRWLPPGYVAKRFIRIIPLFYFSALALAILDYVLLGFDPRYFTTAFRWMAGLEGGLWRMYGGEETVPFNGVYWTLILEIVFYAILPFLFRALRSVRPFHTLICLVFFLLIAAGTSRWVVVHTAPHGLDASDMDNLLKGYLCRIDVFAFGIILAWVFCYSPRLDRIRAVPLPLLLCLILGAAFAVYAWIGAGSGAHLPFNLARSEARHYFAALFAMGLLLVQFQPGTFLYRIFTGRWIVYIGVISYEWYLIHVPIIHFGFCLWQKLAGGAGLYLVLIPGSIVLSLGAAALLHQGFYVPVSRYLRTWKG
jgi:peptidoglycan/LPS O-acetylase OafA/YrhL